MTGSASPPILVRRTVFDAADTMIVDSLIDDYVNPMIYSACYTQDEIPSNAIIAYHVDYYLAQVANGGHGQFLHNCQMSARIISDVAKGLSAIGPEAFAEIFRDLVAFMKNSERAEAAAAKSGFGELDPKISALDKRFLALDCYQTLRPAIGRWIKSLPELIVVDDNIFDIRMQEVFSVHLDRQKRRDAQRFWYKRAYLARLFQTPHYVAGCILGFDAAGHGVLVSYDQSVFAATPDGREKFGWLVSGQSDRYIVFIEDNEALLCEIFAPSGEKIVGQSMAETYSALAVAGVPNSQIFSFANWTTKEVCRLSKEMIEEVAEFARSPVIAAAELACERLGERLTALVPTQKDPKGRWLLIVHTETTVYAIFVLAETFVIFDLAEQERVKISFAEARDYEAEKKSLVGE
ncbi:MAG: DUF4375 domain-containing protein [Hyphomicrobium sp.]|nr:DUF4375 domain-containing protein [Hyphomicrobium sp.]